MNEPRERRQPRQGQLWTIVFAISAALLVVVLAFGAGLITERTLVSGGSLFERAAGPGPDSQAEVDPAHAADAAFPQMAEVKQLLEQEYFFRPPDPDAAATFSAELDQDALAAMEQAAATPAASIAEYRQQLEYAGIHGMTDGLGDPYTVFLEPEIQAPIAADLRGEYEGIGVVVNQPDGRFTVISIFPGSPAAEAGLQPGDVLLAADGTELTDMDSTNALALIRGPVGTKVRLTIARGDEAPFDVEVERRAIETPAVIYETVADGEIAWLRIGIFGDKTTAQLDAALQRAADEGVQGIVLDLRGNGGGWVVSAQEVLGRFVPASAGPALYEDWAPGEADQLESKPIVNGETERFTIPLAVLIDGGTASAAEIVAGALRHYERAALVGSETFGKGSVQRVHDFANGSSARITSARWLTPDKRPIPEAGLRPDYAIPSATAAEGPDLPLEAAVRLLRGEPPLASPVATPVTRQVTWVT